jgi:hypothetical protein
LQMGVIQMSSTDITRGSPVVRADYHRTILKDLPEICRRAGMQEKFFFEGLSEYCTDPREIEYVASYNDQVSRGVFGFVYVKRWPRVEDRMQAMAAALMRNYITVGLYSLKTLVERERKGDFPDPSVMFITSDLAPKGITSSDYHKQLVADTLSDRRVAHKQTICRVENTEAIEKAMPTVWEFIREGYKGIVNKGGKL